MQKLSVQFNSITYVYYMFLIAYDILFRVLYLVKDDISFLISFSIVLLLRKIREIFSLIFSYSDKHSCLLLKHEFY